MLVGVDPLRIPPSLCHRIDSVLPSQRWQHIHLEREIHKITEFTHELFNVFEHISKANNHNIVHIFSVLQGIRYELYRCWLQNFMLSSHEMGKLFLSGFM